MKEFKGTPGPWQVGSETTSGDIRVIDMNGSIVAMVEAKTGDGYQWSPSTVTENADLMASAPEILSVLQKIVESGHVLPHLKIESQWAIAKALGESQ